jgi:hypothetical protein
VARKEGGQLCTEEGDCDASSSAAPNASEAIAANNRFQPPPLSTSFCIRFGRFGRVNASRMTCQPENE